MCNYDVNNKSDKKTLMVCGPQVFKEQLSLTPNDNEEFYLAIVSKSMKEKPDKCHILTADYSLNGKLQKTHEFHVKQKSS